jgi:hypothetical protein
VTAALFIGGGLLWVSVAFGLAIVIGQAVKMAEEAMDGVEDDDADTVEFRRPRTWVA